MARQKSTGEQLEWHAAAQTMLEEARAEAPMADNKAAVLLATLGVGFGVLGAGLLAGDWSPTGLRAPAAILFWVSVATAVASVVLAGSALWPRFTTTDRAGGVYYWGHAADFDSASDLAKALAGTTFADASRASHQLWRLSRAVRRKYALVRRSLVLAAVSIAAMALCLVLELGLGASQ